VLRRPGLAAVVSKHDGAEVIQVHNMHMPVGRHEVLVDGEAAELTTPNFARCTSWPGAPPGSSRDGRFDASGRIVSLNEVRNSSDGLNSASS
jgi:hypothetical protein